MSYVSILEKFRDDVLMSGPDSTLPANLSDFWLCELTQHLNEYFSGYLEEPEESDMMSLPLAAIVHLLFAKNGGKEISIPMEQMFEYFKTYRIELALEEVRRETGVKSEQATLETIFTERDLSFQ